MKDLEFTIRVMEKEDLFPAMNIKNAEGWNQTLSDWELLLYDKPGMCLVALHQNKVIATVSAIGYENKLAWIGMMLVQKEYRGKGLAKILMNSILEVLEGYQSIKLDATPAGFPVYAKLGFVPEYTLYRMVRLSQNNVDQKNPYPNIQATKPRHLQDIVDFDQAVFGANRQRVLQHLYTQSPENVSVIKEENTIKGYIMGRPGTNYHQLGPLMAESTEVSIALLSEALSGLRDCPVVVDILQDKEDLKAWLHTQGFIQQRELIRMYYLNNPYPGIIGQHYLISGPELG